MVDKDSEDNIEKEPQEGAQGAAENAGQGPNDDVLKNLFAAPNHSTSKEVESSLDEAEELENFEPDSGKEDSQGAADEATDSGLDAVEPSEDLDLSLVGKAIADDLIGDIEDEAIDKKPHKKVAKTLIDSEIPKMPAQSESGRQVAKTMLESDLPDLKEMEALIDQAQAQESESTESLEGVLNEEKPRKVTKTVLEREIPQAVQDKVLEAAREIEESQKRISKEVFNRKISRTLIEMPMPKPPGTQKEEEFVYDKPIRDSFVARTMLDHELILDKLSESLERIDQKTREEIAEKEKALANEPIKERIPIDNFKAAKACPWQWEDDGYKDQFRYCGQCKQLVYDFSNMDKPEALSLIFQRENKENPTLFRRTDKKFMTADCPLAVQKQKFLTMVAVSVGSVFILLLLISLLVPKDSPTSVESTPQEEQTQFSGSGQAPQVPTQDQGGITSPGASTSPDGSFYYNADDPAHNTKPQVGSPEQSVNTNPVPDYHGVPEADESGDFWQFPNGKPESDVVVPPAQTPVQPQANPSLNTNPASPIPSLDSGDGQSSEPSQTNSGGHPTVKTY